MDRRPDRFTALIDACTLVGALQRDMILMLAEANVFRVRWSSRILDEMERALAQKVLKIGDEKARHEKAAHLRKKMELAFPEACVSGFEILESSFDDIPDKGDAHVIAAAVRCGASVIVTDNVRHFPESVLGPFDIMVRSPDEFIADALDLDEIDAIEAIRNMRRRFQDPAMSAIKLVETVEARGLRATAELLRGNLDQI